jgi:hypothetical protein
LARWSLALGLLSFSGLLVACDKAPAPSTAPPTTSPSAAATTGSDPHAEHDCSVAHPDPAPRVVATATKLSDEARERADTLRISAPVGSVIIRKTEQGWLLAGPRGCTVSEARMAEAFKGLSSFGAEPTDERPDDFELQIIVLHGQERLLHFDVAHHSQGSDLVQLNDGSCSALGGWIGGFGLPIQPFGASPEPAVSTALAVSDCGWPCRSPSRRGRGAAANGGWVAIARARGRRA